MLFVMRGSRIHAALVVAHPVAHHPMVCRVKPGNDREINYRCSHSSRRTQRSLGIETVTSAPTGTRLKEVVRTEISVALMVTL
jgi:hypothetical protein